MSSDQTYMSKRILISGGSGLLGENITQKALQKGWEVRHLSTRPSTRKDGVRVFGWGKDRFEASALEGVDAVIHLSGASISAPWTLDHKRAILDSRVESSRWLYKALSEYPHSVQHLVSASAVGYYPSDRNKLYSESDAPGHDFLGSVCRKWEAETQRFAERVPCEARLRIGLVLSAKGGLLEPLLPLAKSGLLSPLGDGSQWMSWIHEDDLADLFLYSIENSLCGAFNAVGPHPEKNSAFSRILCKVLGRPMFLPKVPEWALKLALGERSILPLMSQNASADAVLRSGFAFKHPHLEGALRDLLAN
jgi:uncharacterized protein (TIGR01777 family)